MGNVVGAPIARAVAEVHSDGLKTYMESMNKPQVVNVKFAFKQGWNNDYAVYVGTGDMTDEEVLSHGTKLLFAHAEDAQRILAPLLDEEWGHLSYRV